MIRDIVDVTEKQLRKPSKKVQKIDKKVRVVIKDLKDTLKSQKDPEGVGLAGSQIGKNITVFAMMPENEVIIIINPKIISMKKGKTKSKKGEKKVMEGCLSLPNFYGPVDRNKSVKLKYMNEKGETKIENFDGLFAHIIQHEVDHLKGVLFIDRLLEQKQPLFEYKNGEWEEVEL